MKFAKDMATYILNLIAALVEQIVSWLTEPISIPFVSALYHCLTGDQLSVLDLTCLLAAIPATILLDVITGSPTVPDTVSATPTAVQQGELTGSAAEAGRILLGITAFAISEVGIADDTLLLGVESRSGRTPFPWGLLNRIDFAVDFAGYALQMVTAYGWSTWQAQDWAFWIYQSIPQAFNFAYQFRDDGTSELQATRDVLAGVVFLVVSSVYAHYWPSSYKECPQGPRTGSQRQHLRRCIRDLRAHPSPIRLRPDIGAASGEDRARRRRQHPRLHRQRPGPGRLLTRPRHPGPSPAGVPPHGGGGYHACSRRRNDQQGRDEGDR